MHRLRTDLRFYTQKQKTIIIELKFNSKKLKTPDVPGKKTKQRKCRQLMWPKGGRAISLSCLEGHVGHALSSLLWKASQY